ncbi:hypothetical protein D9Q98_005038 [Chlorella vulgaris]|uniref:Solute carrier family 40 member n=1 Tax=Chlorella vulgaris TaxID=3077 RepID=A0A9D4TNP3_CHLVU|nr:hypothetical protein D9Q98_005038 [Chlorella vulgaris]
MAESCDHENEDDALLRSKHDALHVEGAVGPTTEHARACRALLASHFLSTWGQRGWEFTVGLIMLELQPNSLRLVAVWGLVDAAAAVAFGGALGRYVDGCLSRVQAASQMYVLQNAMLVISAVASLLLLWSDVRSGPAFWAALLVMMGAGAASTLGALGSTLSVEREWTKTLCGSDSAALAALNAAMRRIDLSCLIASPIMAGLDMQYGSLSAAVLLLLAWNLCSWFPEVLLLRYAQRCSPALAADKPAPAADSSSSSSSSSGGGGICRRIARSLDQQLQSWTLYACQPAAPAAAALALLYLTVLSWGTLMTAYLKTLGLPEADLAVWRGLGAASGILATLTFPPLHRRLGLVATATLSIWLQLACLLAAVVPSVAAAALGAGIRPLVRRYALVCGLVLSRFGLWSFDLAVTQLMQETCQHASLGAVNGVQGSVQSLFQMLAFGAGVLLPATDSFVWLMAGSCGVVALAAALCTAFALRTSCGAGLGSPLPEAQEEWSEA